MSVSLSETLPLLVIDPSVVRQWELKRKGVCVALAFAVCGCVGIRFECLLVVLQVVSLRPVFHLVTCTSQTKTILIKLYRCF